MNTANLPIISKSAGVTANIIVLAATVTGVYNYAISQLPANVAAILKSAGQVIVVLVVVEAAAAV